MSGIVAILRLDGAPVDAALLERMNASLAFRGPDGRQIWARGQVGFGHALLRTSSEHGSEPQPLSLEGNVWITADARVDAHGELIDNLSAAGCATSQYSSDAELILHAYHVWGNACVEHLIGDFSFAIWDGTARRLFCARDHFGVKPFYYARTANSLILSNTLDCLRLCPGVSRELNDQAIADFLLFDSNEDPSTTSFADIKRLPAAHLLTCERGTISIQCYWKLPLAAPLRYRRSGDYVEHFRDLLDKAVGDRVGPEKVAVFMSGGLDSPTVAASATNVSSARCGGTAAVRAYTQVFERLIPDRERHYAQLVADALNIPIEFLAVDTCKLYERFDRQGCLSPEPANNPTAHGERELIQRVSAWSRVALTGQGADPGLSTLLSVHFRRLIEARQIRRALADALRYLAAQNRWSRLYIRTRCRNWFGDNQSDLPSYPVWLNEDLEKKFDLAALWKEANRPAAPNDSIRPEAWQQMSASAFWSNFFEAYDAGSTRVPLDVRHPFFDLRLVQFLIALPALPWSSDKELLREAARGVLPEEVRLRRKSPLAADPVVALLQQPASAWVDQFEAVPQLERYVRRNSIPPIFKETDAQSASINLRPLGLNYWLKSVWPATGGSN